MLRYVFLYLLLFNTLHAATDLTCATYPQANGVKTWACPDIVDDNSLNASLEAVNIETGEYTCAYSYAGQGTATVCHYSSTDYKANLDAKLKYVQDDIIRAVRDTANINPFNNNYNIVGDIDFIPEREQEEAIEELNDHVDANISTLSTFYNKVIAANNYLFNLLDITPEIRDADQKSYDELVKPYVSGTLQRDEETFSRFITGMVTLDPKVVKGYDENTGKLIIADAWDTNVHIDIFDLFKRFAGIENNNTNAVNTDKFNVNNWIGIFQQKIWGFYYNLQRRMDIGYDIITTQLLFIMMAFFAIVTAARGSARYITNRENGQSSGEVKINEANIMRTLGILATVFVFYISVPSVISSTNKVTSDTDIPHEMAGNSSLIKGFIRYTMEKGSYFGTMMADLGTDAFLQYVIQKQGLNNGLKERNNLVRSLQTMVYYYPALEIANECRRLTGLSDDRLTSGNANISIDPEHAKTSVFLADNGITELSSGLCKSMIDRTANTIYNIELDIQDLNDMINKDIPIRIQATSALVKNHILLQKELGWMNIVAVPYTYFMMKNQELFFESSLDIKGIEAKTKKFIRTTGLRDSEGTLASTTWVRDITQTRLNVSKADKDGEQNSKEYTRLAVYNFLPGFTSIRNEVLQRIQSLYSDILRLERIEGKTSTRTTDFQEFLEKLIDKAQKYYSDTRHIYGQKKLYEMIKEGTNDPIRLHQAFMVISYVVAMSIWKSGFIIIFLSSIAMIIGLKVVLYVINILIHFFISPFIVVWAFATSPEGGMSKIKTYMRDTLIYMLYPSIIVIGVFVFIFSYELFYSIYGFITSVLIEGQLDAVSNAILATNGAKPTQAEMSFLSVYALRDITEILIDLLSVYVAFMTINKFPELVLKMMGLGDSAVIMLPQANEAIQSKGGGNVSPLSK